MRPDRRRFLQLTATGMVASLTSSACGRDATEDSRALARPLVALSLRLSHHLKTKLV